jgi:hypothetical protein
MIVLCYEGIYIGGSLPETLNRVGYADTGGHTVKGGARGETLNKYARRLG